MLKSKSLPILAGAAALGIALAATPASAGVFTSELTVSNVPATGDFGTLTITTVSTTSATFAFTAAAGFGFVDSDIADVNLKTAVPAGSFTAITPASPDLTDTGAGTVDGFGTFNLTTKAGSSVCTGGAPCSTVSYSILGDFSGATSIFDILSLNSKGFDAAGHMICTGADCTFNGGLTFFAAEVPAPPIGHGLPVVLGAGGLLFGAWFFGKKRPLLGNAIPRAA